MKQDKWRKRFKSFNPLLIRIYDPSQVLCRQGAGGPRVMWWAFAIVVWTLLSFVASPLIGGVLAGGHALKVREKGLFDLQGRPLQPTIQ